MNKYLIALCAFLMLGCRVDRVPDYGSRDAYSTGLDGCLSAGTSISGSGFLWMLAFLILLTAVIAYHFGKKKGGK